MTDNINSAHGKEQNIKMNLLKWLNEGKDPYSIIYELAKYLETVSSEPGYADIILNDIRTVYGTVSYTHLDVYKRQDKASLIGRPIVLFISSLGRSGYPSCSISNSKHFTIPTSEFAKV